MAELRIDGEVIEGEPEDIIPFFKMAFALLEEVMETRKPKRFAYAEGDRNSSMAEMMRVFIFTPSTRVTMSLPSEDSSSEAFEEYLKEVERESSHRHSGGQAY